MIHPHEYPLDEIVGGAALLYVVAGIVAGIGIQLLSFAAARCWFETHEAPKEKSVGKNRTKGNKPGKGNA